MSVERPNVELIRANTSNYTPGRSAPISRITFHHIVGDGPSAVAKFQTVGTAVSSNYVISSNGTIYQTVADTDTAWCDGNWPSNQRTISIEHAGGLPEIPYTDAMYNASKALVAWLIQTYGITDFKRHREVSDRPTACPGGLDVEGIVAGAQELISAASAPATTPTPAPQASGTRYERLPSPRRMVYNKDTNIWGLNATRWSDFNAVKQVQKGDGFTVIGIAHHPLGGQYYMSETWFADADTSGRPRYNIGVNTVDMDDYVAPIAPQPTPAPTPTTTPTTTPEQANTPETQPQDDPGTITPPVQPQSPTPSTINTPAGMLARLFAVLLRLLTRIWRQQQ